jgi:flagellar biosynthesis chaperone FliJ
MDNPRIEKVKAEIEKTKAKINEYQAKLRALERQKVELENERIVALVRGEKISDAELDMFMQSLRKGKPAATQEREIKGTEGTRYADTIEN